jgi:hypothetical protein
MTTAAAAQSPKSSSVTSSAALDPKWLSSASAGKISHVATSAVSPRRGGALMRTYHRCFEHSTHFCAYLKSLAGL